MFKKGMILVSLLISSVVNADVCSSWKYEVPWWTIRKISRVPTSPQLGENIRMKFQIRTFQRGHEYPPATTRSNVNFSFSSLPGTSVTWEPAGGTCPTLPNGSVYIPNRGHCDVNVVIPINNFKPHGGALSAHLYGRWDLKWRHDCLSANYAHKWDHTLTLPQFSITNIRPKPLSFKSVGALEIKAGQPYSLNINALFDHLEQTHQYEKFKGMQVKNSSIAMTMTAGASGANGLSLIKKREGNAQVFRLNGTPLKTGTYTYTLKTNNFNSLPAADSKPYPLTLKVTSDPGQRPVLKDNVELERVNVGKPFSINLLSLLDSPKQVLAAPYNKIQANHLAFANPVHFRLFPGQEQSEQISNLRIENNHLKGTAKPGFEGAVDTLRLYAHSDIGGNSDVVNVMLPVATESQLRPEVKNFQSTVEAGMDISVDFSKHIIDKTKDNNLQLVIDKTEPLASFLSISSVSKLWLSGTIPSAYVGETIKVYYHANNTRGGQSEQAIAEIKVNIDRLRTPEFDVYQLPTMHPGQAYHYDFVKNRAISPLYKDYPYQISFAKGYPVTNWLRLENNVLIADKVPSDLEAMRYPVDVDVYLIVTNKPGGSSIVRHYIVDVIK